MSPSGPYRLASSVAVLLASPKLGAVKRTFLLCSKGTLSLCRVMLGVECLCSKRFLRRLTMGSRARSRGQLRGTPAGAAARNGLTPVVNNRAADNRHQRFDRADLVFRTRQEIPVDNHRVGQCARFQRSSRLLGEL